MIDKIIAKAFVNAMKESMKNSNEEEHHFDANADKCKNCETFEICRMFHGMGDKIEAADIDEKVKNDLTKVLAFIREETIILDKDIEFPKFRLQAITERFECLKECKNFDVLIDILDEADLKYIRSIILKVNNKISNELAKVMDANRAECNYFMDVFRKPEVEEKRYEDMIREELLEELKKK